MFNEEQDAEEGVVATLGDGAPSGGNAALPAYAALDQLVLFVWGGGGRQCW